jgi:hypothetical protein
MITTSAFVHWTFSELEACIGLSLSPLTAKSFSAGVRGG